MHLPLVPACSSGLVNLDLSFPGNCNCGIYFAYTLVASSNMEKPQKHIMASFILDSRLYHALSNKFSRAFLSRLSRDYPSFFHAQRLESDAETAVGYEAAWVGVAQQIRRNKGIQ